MENQTHLEESVDSQRRKNGECYLPTRPHDLEGPSTTVTEERGPSLLLEYLGVFRRHKGTLILLALAGVLASVLVTVPQSPIYQAHAVLEIQNLNENFLNMRDMNPTTNELGPSQAESDLQTQVKILQSDSVLARVIAKLHFEKKMPLEKRDAKPSAWRRALHLTESSPDAQEEALRLVTKNLKVSTDTNTRLVAIVYDSTDPQLAADFVNTLTAEFVQQNVEARWKTTQQTGEWLTNQMEDARTKLEKSQDELQSYARASGLLFTSEKVGTQLLEDNVADQKLRQLQEELSNSHGDRVTKQSMYELASNAPPESLPEVLDDKTLGDYQVKLTDLRRRLAELTSSLTPANPAVKKVQAQVNTLESALLQERAAVIQRVRNEYRSAHRRENLLAANYASQARLVSEQAAEVAHYNILKSDVDSNRQLYDSMLRNVQEAGMISALGASNIRIVDPAKVPTRPYRPRPILNLLLGLVAGTSFGFVFVVMRERADRSIQIPGETALYLGVRELGVIPSLDAERSRFFAYYQNGRATKSTDLKDDRGTLQVGLITSLRSQSVMADCFRAAATSILYAGENGNRPRVIVVSSARPGEGKTTVATNLALALAEIGSSVLLIDGDLRKGRLHEIFQVSNCWGVSDLLAGKKRPPNCAKMYLETGYECLHLLPAGSTLSNIPGLLHSPLLLEFLNHMREDFHTVVIDAPPMLQMPDARILGRLSDGVILVVRCAETTADEAVAAAQRLREDGSHVMGTILNKWDPRKTSYSGYAYGRQYHCYHQSG